MMKTWALLLIPFASLQFAACKSNALEEMENVTKKMCACENQACVKALEDEFTRQQAKTESLHRDDQERALKLSLEALDCATKLSN